MIQLLGIIGEPMSGKDYIAKALAAHLGSLVPVSIVPVGVVLRKHVPLEVFQSDPNPEAPSWCDDAAIAMINVGLTMSRTTTVAIGCPRNEKQVQHFAKFNSMILYVHGKWKRVNGKDDDALAKRVSEVGYLPKLLSIARYYNIPIMDLWNTKQIGLPDTWARWYLPEEVLWDAARPHIPSGVAR